MNMKKILAVMAVCFSVHVAALAHGNLACNVSADLENMQKIVLYPFSDAKFPQQFLDNGEGTSIFEENNYLWKKLNKKIEKCNFLRLSKGPFEEGRVLGNNYSFLLNEYPNEEERAKAVCEAAMADAYLIPRFRENSVRIDRSPETLVHIPLRAWTEEIDSSKGSRTYGDYTWIEHHVIPAAEIPCRVMDIEYEIRNKDGKLVFTYENSGRSYSASEKEMFEELVKEFVDDLKDVMNGKYAHKPSKAGIRIGMGTINAPTTISQDKARARTFLAVLLNEQKRLKNAVIDLDEDTPYNYVITGLITNFEMKPEWIPPSTTTVNNCMSSETKNWRDSKGRPQHTIKKRYRQSVEDHYGYYTYTGYVSADLKLEDARTGEVVVSCQGERTSDKEIDACRHVVREFYKKVNQYLKEKHG